MTSPALPPVRRRPDGPDILVVVTAATWAGLVLVAFSFAGSPFFWVIGAVAASLATGVVWLTVLILSLVQRRRRLGLLVAVLLAGLVVGALAVNAPVKARFLVSEPSFDALIAQVGEPEVRLPAEQPGEKALDKLWDDFPGSCPKHVGLFSIASCDVFPAGYLFYDTTGAMFDDAGLAYMPEGEPPYDIGNGSFESPDFVHLHGHWYAFTSSW